MMKVSPADPMSRSGPTVNRKVSQLTLTAFVQLNTNVGQIR